MFKPNNILALMLLILTTAIFPSKSFAGISGGGGSSGSVCAENQSQIPENSIVTRARTDFSCGTNVRLDYRAPFNGVRMCSSFTLVPEGYVVTQVQLESSCNNSVAWTIRVPAGGTSQTRICGTIGPSNFVSGFNVPEGYVVTSRNQSSSACATSGTAIEWRIRLPSATGVTAICPLVTSVPIPTGYVVTRDTRTSSACSGGIGQSNRQLEIRPASDGLWTCNGYTGIPDGFASIGTSTNVSSCSGNATRIGIPQNNSLVCGAGDAPAGFVKTEILTATTCNSSLGFRVRQLSTIGNTQIVNVCGSFSTAPDGFIVTEVLTSTSCSISGLGNAFRIRRPSTTGNSNTCSSNFPDGYGVVAVNNSANCSNSGSGINYVIQPFVNGSIYCSAFDTPLPTGWVVTRRSSSNNCSAGSGSGFNMTIGLPNATGITNICENDANNIPDGYVLIRQVGTTVCGSLSEAFVIRQPFTNGETTICAVSPLPSDFIRVQTGINNSQCPFDSADVIRPINVGGTFNICPGSPIPDGFVVIAKPSSTACPPFGSILTITQAVTSGTMNVCSDSPLPTGFVIYRIASSVNQCDQEVGFPNPTGTTATCSQPPEGFIIIGTVNSSACGGLDANLIVPADLLLPSEFVDPINNVVPGTVPAINYDCGSTPQNGGFVNNQPRTNTTCN